MTALKPGQRYAFVDPELDGAFYHKTEDGVLTLCGVAVFCEAMHPKPTREMKLLAGCRECGVQPRVLETRNANPGARR